MNIVIAEHDIILRKKLRQILEANGHLVLAEAQNGLHAFNKFLEYQPELIIISLEMPVFDGLSTVDKILKSDPKANIIILGEKNNNRKLYQAIEYGAKHYISLPLIEEEVVRIISTL